MWLGSLKIITFRGLKQFLIVDEQLKTVSIFMRIINRMKKDQITSEELWKNKNESKLSPFCFCFPTKTIKLTAKSNRYLTNCPYKTKGLRRFLLLLIFPFSMSRTFFNFPFWWLYVACLTQISWLILPRHSTGFSVHDFSKIPMDISCEKIVTVAHFGFDWIHLVDSNKRRPMQ